MDIPAHLKLQILSHLPPQLVYDVLAPNPSLVTPYDLISNLKDKSGLKFFTENALNELQAKGFIIRDNFLGKENLQATKQQASTLYAQGHLKAAGMNKGEDKWVHSDTRGDSILWLDKDDKSFMDNHTAISELILEIDSIRKELNLSCGFKSPAVQIQLARYPAGARYVRHRDAILPKEREDSKDYDQEDQSKLRRRLTVLYYMNEDWREEHGGQLRMYLSDGKHIDIEPIGDRLVVFWSALMEHEVLLSNHERYAMTVWFY